jgi:hypothetical protein
VGQVPPGAIKKFMQISKKGLFEGLPEKTLGNAPDYGTGSNPPG